MKIEFIIPKILALVEAISLEHFLKHNINRNSFCEEYSAIALAIEKY